MARIPVKTTNIIYNNKSRYDRKPSKMYIAKMQPRQRTFYNTIALYNKNNSKSKLLQECHQDNGILYR